MKKQNSAFERLLKKLKKNELAFIFILIALFLIFAFILSRALFFLPDTWGWMGSRRNFSRHFLDYYSHKKYEIKTSINNFAKLTKIM